MQHVTALMITGKTEHHRRLATVAVRCFLDQTYASAYRSLLVINTSKTAPWFSGVENPTGSEVEICLPQAGKTLGDLRNLSYDIATAGSDNPTDLLLQWDDDDYHHPDRMAWQVENHVAGKCSILQRQYRLNLYGSWGVADASRWQYGGIVGTMLHEINDYRYPSWKKAEDTAYLGHYLPDRVNPQDNPVRLYVRLYHGDNTWDRKKVMRPALTNGNKFKGDADYIASIRRLYDPPEASNNG